MDRSDKRKRREGEAEKPEATVSRNGAEGVSVDPEGESRHGQARAKITRMEREHQANMEEKVDGKALGEKGAEIQRLKWEVIRVESEETLDYVRESLNMSRDEAEARSFVSSAISTPERHTFWCGDRCSDKALRFWPFASVVVEDGKESYTANLCQQCYDESLTAKGLALLKNWKWKVVVEKKAWIVAGYEECWKRPVHTRYVRVLFF